MRILETPPNHFFGAPYNVDPPVAFLTWKLLRAGNETLLSPLSQSISESLRSFCDPHQCAKVIQPYPVPNLTSWVFGKPQETTGWLLHYPKLVTNGSPFRCFILMGCRVYSWRAHYSEAHPSFLTVFYPFNPQPPGIFLDSSKFIPENPRCHVWFSNIIRLPYFVDFPGKVPELHRFKTEDPGFGNVVNPMDDRYGYHQWIRGKIHAMELGIFIAKSTN